VELRFRCWEISLVHADMWACPLMYDSSFPIHPAASVLLSDGLENMADCLIDSGFAYPNLRT
jgi:hypothetical protein